MLEEAEKSYMTDNSMRYENSEKVMHATIVEVIDNQVSMKICSWLCQRQLHLMALQKSFITSLDC